MKKKKKKRIKVLCKSYQWDKIIHSIISFRGDYLSEKFYAERLSRYLIIRPMFTLCRIHFKTPEQSVLYGKF